MWCLLCVRLGDLLSPWPVCLCRVCVASFLAVAAANTLTHSHASVAHVPTMPTNVQTLLFILFNWNWNRHGLVGRWNCINNGTKYKMVKVTGEKALLAHRRRFASAALPTFLLSSTRIRDLVPRSAHAIQTKLLLFAINSTFEIEHNFTEV